MSDNTERTRSPEFRSRLAAEPVQSAAREHLQRLCSRRGKSAEIARSLGISKSYVGVLRNVAGAFTVAMVDRLLATYPIPKSEDSVVVRSHVALRGYETDWIHRVHTLRKAHAVASRRPPRILLVGPTGSGKTVLAARDIADWLRSGGRVLFVAHTAQLIRQCVVRLREYGIRQSDIGVIMSQLGDEENSSARVQVASVQTLHARSHVRPPATLLVIDEAHHIVAKTYQRLLADYPYATVLGLTATPWRLDGKGLGDAFDAIIETRKVSELIAEGWLASPRVFTVPPDQRANLSEVRIRGADFELQDLNRAVNRRELCGNLVEHWKRLANKQPTICYVVNVEHATQIADEFWQSGITSEVVSAETPYTEREKVLARLESGQTQVVVNCMIFVEGWDCPPARVCILARPTLSTALYLQMCGRVMRPGPTPLILDHAGNALWHGLPQEDRNWSLEHGINGRPSRKPAPERVCPECGSANVIGRRSCANCGHEFWSTESPRQHHGRLVEITTSVMCSCGRRLRGRWLTTGVCFTCEVAARRATLPTNCKVCGKALSKKRHSEKSRFLTGCCRECAKRDPDRNRRVSEGLKASGIGERNRAPERREHNSKASKRLWAEPEFRAKALVSHKPTPRAALESTRIVNACCTVCGEPYNYEQRRRVNGHFGKKRKQCASCSRAAWLRACAQGGKNSGGKPKSHAEQRGVHQ
jgi:DNA repair protein RadD